MPYEIHTEYAGKDQVIQATMAANGRVCMKKQPICK